MRDCGVCNLCCKIIKSADLQKEAGRLCEFWDPELGCKINSVKPDSCNNFSCLWRIEAIPAHLSPRKTGVVAWITKDHRLMLQQDRKANALFSFANEIKEWISRGQDVHVVRAS
jgi:hypothetical protein